MPLETHAAHLSACRTESHFLYVMMNVITVSQASRNSFYRADKLRETALELIASYSVLHAFYHLRFVEY